MSAVENIVIRIDAETKKKLKLYAIQIDKNMTDVIKFLVNQELKNETMKKEC